MLLTVCGVFMLLLGYLLYRQLTAANRRRDLTTRLRMQLVELAQAEDAFNVYTDITTGYFARYTF